MALRMIIGGSGSGKSTYLFHQILGLAAEEPGRRFLLLVPEQFTMAAQRELVKRSPKKAIMNVDVLSFNRLAYRIFEETGTRLNDVLEDAGKNLLLRRVAQEHEDELTVLRGNVRRPGSIDEIKSLLTEMEQYRIGPEEFADLAELPEMSRAFQRKARDLSVIYRAFRQEIEGRYITAEEVLDRLVQVMDRSSMIRDAVIAFDGFTGFTPIQKQVLAKMMRLASSILVTMTMDPGERISGRHLDYELFAMTKAMGEDLLRLSREADCRIEEPVYCREEHRFAGSPMLAHLEANLFRPKSKAYMAKEEEAKEEEAKGEEVKGEDRTGYVQSQIRLGRAANFRDELAFAGEEIKKKIRQEKGQYRDFAIVCANLPDYADYVALTFQKMDLPYYLDQNQEVLFHPLFEFILSSLAVLIEDFSEESLVHQLRSGLSDMAGEDVDLLERYIHARQIRGFARYRRPFGGMAGKLSRDRALRLEELRREIVSDLADFREQMCSKEASSRDRAIALYRYLEGHRVEDRLEAKADACQAAGDEIAASVHRRVFGLAMGVLEKMSDLLGEEKMPLADFAQLLEAGFASISVPTVPPSLDAVVVGDLERTRLENIKTLYVLGVSDAAVPKAAEGGGLFSQADREKLRARQIELAPGDRERAFMQRFYLYLALTKPSDQLVITYARLSRDGSALRESYLISLIRKLFPGLRVENLEEREDRQRLATAPLALDYLPDALRGMREQTSSDRERQLACAVYRELAEDETFAGRARMIFETVFGQPGQVRLSQEIVRAVTGDLICGSVSRLEQYVRCAYAYYLRYGLLLQDQEEPDMDDLDMGNFYHRTLELYSKDLKEEGLSWQEISDRDSDAVLERAFDRALEEMERADFLERRRQEHVILRMKTVLRRTIWALRQQAARGDFVPEDFEMAFGPKDRLASMNFRLREGDRMQLRGKIDRVDCLRTDGGVYVKLTDYKSGSREIDLTRLYHGLQIQLILYMTAALEKLGRDGRKVHPAGLFYFHVDEPWIKSKEGAGEEEIREEQLAAHQLRGLYNCEDLVVNALDRSLAEPNSEASRVISAKRKKDGSLAASRDALTEEDLRLLGDYVHGKIEETGRHILGGRIEKDPYQLGGENGCQYCGFRPICGFENGLRGMHFHRMINYKSSQVLDLIREKMEDKAQDEMQDEMQDKMQEKES